MEKKDLAVKCYRTALKLQIDFGPAQKSLDAILK